ncbi:MAG: hypothetical protein IPP40_13165 [bacterium]|nr:hypothetical protein [bacterium]
MRLFACLILSVSLQSIAFAGAGNRPIPLPEDSVKIVQARHKILEIWKASQIYSQDRGIWPESVELLDSLNYIKLDSAMRTDWTFRFFGNPPSKINATQNYLAKNAKQGGMGLPHAVNYDIETGYWDGSGVHRTGLIEQFFRVQDVQSSMCALASASSISYQDRGSYSNVVQLVRDRYVIIPANVKINWNLRMYGAPPDSTVATSTDWMQDGPDHR